MLGEGEADSMLPALAAGVLGPGAEVAKGRVRGPSVISGAAAYLVHDTG